jgi:hypothetical protein
VRVPIDRPYADAKSLLLAVVARAGRSRSVFHRGLDLSTIVGFAADVAACEMLFTSLLLQAQHALARAAGGASAGGRTRRKSYRSAFLFAYAHRIGDRLEEINQLAGPGSRRSAAAFCSAAFPVRSGWTPTSTNSSASCARPAGEVATTRRLGGR